MTGPASIYSEPVDFRDTEQGARLYRKFPDDVSPHVAIATSIFAGLTRAYAGFAQVRAAQEEQKAQSSAMGHRARMLQLDRRWALQRAESILQQGQGEVGRVSLAGEQRRAAITASAAARGVEAGVGSAAEVLASEKLIEQIDVYNITLDSVRQAGAVRQGARNIENEGRFARASSRNLRRGANAAAPEASLLAGLGSSALSAAYLSNYRRA